MTSFDLHTATHGPDAVPYIDPPVGALGIVTRREARHSPAMKLVRPLGRMIISAHTARVHRGVIGSEPD